jgi:hypothetical protein
MLPSYAHASDGDMHACLASLALFPFRDARPEIRRKRAPGVSEWLATFGDLSAVDTAISADGTVMVRRRFLFGNLRFWRQVGGATQPTVLSV